MSPNMQVKRLFAGLVERAKKWALKAPKSGKHHLGSHAESVYIWTLLGVDAETSQELRARRTDRRTNGFATVKMTLRGAE